MILLACTALSFLTASRIALMWETTSVVGAGADAGWPTTPDEMKLAGHGLTAWLSPSRLPFPGWLRRRF
jgi:hypothetical protein